MVRGGGTGAGRINERGVGAASTPETTYEMKGAIEMQNTTTKKETNRSEEQAKWKLASICEMVDALLKAENEGNDEARDEAEQRIREHPLSVEVRPDWYTPGADPKDQAFSFKILLCTGGPAVRIVGELNDFMEPKAVWIEHQDWYEPWKRLDWLTEEQGEKLLRYCHCFYFGE